MCVHAEPDPVVSGRVTQGYEFYTRQPAPETSIPTKMVPVQEAKKAKWKPKKGSRTLPGGTLRAIHVYVPALQAHLSGEPAKPMMAVRSKDQNGEWRRMRIFREIKWDGPTTLHKTDPMPGTAGRGVAIVFTAAPLRCYWDGEEPKTQFITGD